MENINLILPEITLFLGICFALMAGVFFKNSFSIVMKLSILILLGVIYLILNVPNNTKNSPIKPVVPGRPNAPRTNIINIKEKFGR